MATNNRMGRLNDASSDTQTTADMDTPSQIVHDITDNIFDSVSFQRKHDNPIIKNEMESQPANSPTRAKVNESQQKSI